MRERAGSASGWAAMSRDFEPGNGPEKCELGTGEVEAGVLGGQPFLGTGFCLFRAIEVDIRRGFGHLGQEHDPVGQYLGESP